MRRPIIFLLLTTIIFTSLLTPTRTAAARPPQDEQSGADTSPDRLKPDQAKSIIETRAREVVRAIKDGDMKKLSTFVHPRKGVHFAPYVYAEQSDRKLQRGQIVSLYGSNRRLKWGQEDGTGDPILLTFKQYLKQYVYQQDLVNATEINYNTLAQRGNTKNNLFNRYPRAIIVEYHHAGKDPQQEGFSWQSLWLVFEKVGQSWYLVALANDEWTT